MSSFPRTPLTPHAQPVSQRRVFDGYHALDIVTVKPRSLRSGNFLDTPVESDVFSCSPFSVIVPYVPETDDILLSQQFRLPVFTVSPENAFLVECAAGVIDRNETPEYAARRELREETGAEALDLVSAGSFFSTPGCCDEVFHVFVGRISPDTRHGEHGLAEEGEEIISSLLPAPDVFAMLDAGAIRNGPSALALNWFARHRERLRDAWLAPSPCSKG